MGKGAAPQFCDGGDCVRCMRSSSPGAQDQLRFNRDIAERLVAAAVGACDGGDRRECPGPVLAPLGVASAPMMPEGELRMLNASVPTELYRGQVGRIQFWML